MNKVFLIGRLVRDPELRYTGSNIAVATIELSKDVFDTHEYLMKLKADNLNRYNDNFNEYYNEYKLED